MGDLHSCLVHNFFILICRWSLLLWGNWWKIQVLLKCWLKSWVFLPSYCPLKSTVPLSHEMFVVLLLFLPRVHVRSGPVVEKPMQLLLQCDVSVKISAQLLRHHTAYGSCGKRISIHLGSEDLLSWNIVGPFYLLVCSIKDKKERQVGRLLKKKVGVGELQDDMRQMG